MKFLLYIVFLGGAIALGMFPSLRKPRPAFTKIITIALISIVVALALYPPTIGTIADVVRAKAAHLENQKLNVVLQPDWNTVKQTNNAFSATTYDGISVTAQLGESSLYSSNDLFLTLQSLQSEQSIVVQVHATDSANVYAVDKIVGAKPAIWLPYIPALEERARIMYFHVPMSWVAFLAYFVTLICSIQYLRTKNLDWEIQAASSAAIGTLFCALAYITGSVWAKFNWGKFYSGDPREISVLILLLIYGAYFVLRGSVDGNERRARLTSVYAILGCVAAMFLMFIVPRIMQGLHPGSSDDKNIGPLASMDKDAIDLTKAVIFSMSLGGFTLLYFWLLNLGIRLRMIEEKVLHHEAV